MVDRVFDMREFNDIIKQTIDAIEMSKNEIYHIVEHARVEFEQTKEKIDRVQAQVARVIEHVDTLQRKEKEARQHLMVVSRDLTRYKESDIKAAYENATELRLQLQLKQNEEKQLIKQRRDLEMSLRKVERILESGQKLINQVGIALNFITSDSIERMTSQSTHEDRVYVGLRVLEAQEEERRRISREIHDGPAQAMANIVFKAEITKAVFKRDTNQGFAELDELKETVRQTLDEVRKIIYDLRPMSLDDIGLMPTIRKHLDKFKEETGIKIEFHATEMKEEVDKIIQLAIFRILQEIMNNVKKHSKADLMKLQIAFGSKYLSIKVTDDGVGFDYEETLDRVKREGQSYGLLGLKSRVEDLHGSLKVNSEMGKGTSYYVKIPISKEVMMDDFDAD